MKKSVDFMIEAFEDIKKAGCNALAVYLGNFGPEIAETLPLAAVSTFRRKLWPLPCSSFFFKNRSDF